MDGGRPSSFPRISWIEIWVASPGVSPTVEWWTNVGVPKSLSCASYENSSRKGSEHREQWPWPGAHRRDPAALFRAIPRECGGAYIMIVMTLEETWGEGKKGEVTCIKSKGNQADCRRNGCEQVPLWTGRNIRHLFLLSSKVLVFGALIKIKRGRQSGNQTTTCDDMSGRCSNDGTCSSSTCLHWTYCASRSWIFRAARY